MVAGRFFPPHSARVIQARAVVSGDATLRIETIDGALLIEAPGKRVRISSRLAHVARRFEFRDGARFETDDNDGADEIVAALRGRTSIIHRIERSWRWIAASVVAAAALAYVFVEYGIPVAALWLAERTPHRLAVIVSDQTMQFFDSLQLSASRLPPGERQHAATLFRRVALHEPNGLAAYQLLFRRGGFVGANAFALPDGRVVITDELWQLAKNDEEVEGVFAHEMAHVNHAHGLQRVYQASLIPAALALLTGDPSQFSQAATVLPGILIQSAYSRAFEQEADDDAAATLKRMGASPRHLAELLERLEARHCGKTGCGPSWIGTHPDTASRAARLLREAREP